MTRIYVAETGDGRTAIFEKATDEPLAYVPQGASIEKMTARWEEILANRDREARG